MKKSSKILKNYKWFFKIIKSIYYIEYFFKQNCIQIWKKLMYIVYNVFTVYDILKYIIFIGKYLVDSEWSF